MFFSSTSSTRHGLSFGLRGLAKLMKSVMMPFNRVASSTMMSGIALGGVDLGNLFLEQLGGAADDAERVADLVRDTGRHLPHGRQPLRPARAAP